MKTRDLAAAIFVVLLLFGTGYWTRGCVDDRGVVSDTTAVVVKPPAPSTTTGTPGTVPPKIVYRDRLVPDSSALWQSAWLQNENARLSEQLDSLMADKDSLRARLDVLLAPHTAVSPFQFSPLLGDQGYLKGTAEQAYIPMKQEFGLKLTPTDLSLPVITNTKHPAWWVKPVVFVGGATTMYFVTEKNSTGALISGGLTLIPIIVEF